MDSRYMMDSVGSSPYNHFLTSSAASAPPHHSLSAYLDRDTGRQDLLGPSARAQYAPPPAFSLSSGQGYFTVESLEGGAAAPGDMLGARPDGEGHLGLGQQGFENSMFVSGGLQNGVGQQLSPPFGVPAPAHYLPPRMSQETDLRRGGAVSGERSYLLHEQSGIFPGGAAYEHSSLFPGGAAYEHPAPLPHPSLGPGFGGPTPHSPGPGFGGPSPHPSVGPSFGGPQEMELKHRDELTMAALGQRRDIEHEARFREARIHEGRIREAQIREAQMREAQIREAQIREARIRDARLSFIQERSLERRGRPPFAQRQLGLSSGSRRMGQGGNKTWCSVCKLECDTSFNLKGHLGGKKHKLKLAEEAMKSSEKSVVKKDNSNTEGALKSDESEAQKTEVNKADKIQPGNAVAKVKLDHLLNGSDEEEVPTIIASEASTLGKRSTAEDTDTVENPTKKLKQESSAIGNNSDGLSGRASGNQFVDKKGTGKKILRCQTCNVICFSKFDLDVHLGGKRHAFHLKQLQQDGGDKVEKANQAGLKPKDVSQAAVSADGFKEGAKKEVGLSALCAQAERTGRTNG